MIELILTALAVGAGGVLSGALGEAGTDAYNTIKKRLLRLFKGNRAAVEALQEHEKDPEGWEKPLEKYLREILTEKDQTIVKLAEKLLELTGHDEESRALRIYLENVVKRNRYLALGVFRKEESDVTSDSGRIALSNVYINLNTTN